MPGSFATPLTSAVIAAILGVPEEDTALLQTWAQRSFRTGAGEVVDPEAQAEALHQLLGYLADAAALRRANPSKYDDLLGDLVQAEVDGDRLLEDEVKWLSQGIFVAGYETTANAIGNGMALLAANPDERRKLRADPGLIADAFEEIDWATAERSFTGRFMLRGYGRLNALFERR